MRHTIYIRDADEAAWQAITDKPEWLHNRLTRTITWPITPESTQTERIAVDSANPGSAGETQPKQSSIGIKFCKNGHIIPEGRSKCTAKGCKYS